MATVNRTAGMRKIQTFASLSGKRTATVYKDTTWGEYRIVFTQDGNDLPKADYHTDDRREALENAHLWTQEPTPEQQPAIDAFKLKHGKHWKERLTDAWMTGRDCAEPNGHFLRQVRNQLGPAWLCTQPVK